MKELEFLSIIKKTLSESSYIGDDCACLEDLDVFVTHDTLVEDVHFSMFTTSPYLLGRKSVAVNLSDLSAALCTPKYITVSISLPSSVSSGFVSQLYSGINEICQEYNVKVAGGDITSGEKIVISICAIGKRKSLFQTSRKYAKNSDIVVVTGNFGAAATGLYALQNFLYAPDILLNKHKNPSPRVKEGLILSGKIGKNIAAIDTSDGLVPALFQIAQASKHSIVTDYDKIPVCSEVKDFCRHNKIDETDFVLFGGEDYELVACVDEDTFKLLDKNVFIPVGRVLNKDTSPVVTVKSKDFSLSVDEKMFLQKSFNHFGV